MSKHFPKLLSPVYDKKLYTNAETVIPLEILKKQDFCLNEDFISHLEPNIIEYSQTKKKRFNDNFQKAFDKKLRESLPISYESDQITVDNIFLHLEDIYSDFYYSLFLKHVQSDRFLLLGYQVLSALLFGIALVALVIVIIASAAAIIGFLGFVSGLFTVPMLVTAAALVTAVTSMVLLVSAGACVQNFNKGKALEVEIAVTKKSFVEQAQNAYHSFFKNVVVTAVDPASYSSKLG